MSLVTVGNHHHRPISCLSTAGHKLLEKATRHDRLTYPPTDANHVRTNQNFYCIQKCSRRTACAEVSAIQSRGSRLTTTCIVAEE